MKLHVKQECIFSFNASYLYWICIMCIDGESILLANKKDFDVRRVQALLLNRLNGIELPPRLHGLDNEYNTLYKLLKQTITAGESNSCLLIGNRGTGKTALVRTVLRDLQKSYKEFCIVRLNGLTETNDRLALNEIARQLVKEQKEHAEHTFTSFADSFDYLLSLLKSGDKASLPVIFILDEFDLFAQHPKQALLYNLFDAAQSAQNPMAVIGLTCRLDTLDLLEKRVKSRFSHRQIYLFPSSNFGQFLEIAKGTLELPENYPSSTEFNRSLEELFQHPTLNSILRRIFDISKDIRMFHKICFPAVYKLRPEAPYLDLEEFLESSLIQRADSKTEILKGIALLELILIISMKKLMEKDITTFNFQMVYDEYKDFMNQTQINGMGIGMKLYKKAVALKAFENLQMFELVCPVDIAGKCPKEYRMTKLMLEQAQVTEAVLKYNCSQIVKKWATGAA
ncbi:origin recognition complex subunit 4 C-terminus-domain-containing protein [Cokeromyces recurvatus]|uniref:origin recognition complex subunit 4 C-terminus-domain-containing protein n=1 Tax=Cokeromyces recurvatus TaxID=90255 RepID=UPI00221F6CEC|nr:origin recognition complex subunit 4 C-terminus-domain-containing protein [Cokeromyces recurvatus]KAI7897866.1 origin recognition complex subunit 4 C-terminus-domain-containing protein [Cokeromyces recurvatus]